MAFQILFEGSVPKHLDCPDDNEDAFLSRCDLGRLVVSDGASESFDARRWAQLLVERMIDQRFSSEGLMQCIQTYGKLHDRHSLSWSKAAAYERGSFATLLIAQHQPENSCVIVESIGDSLAIWSDGQQILESTPYHCAEQFQQKPILLASRREMNHCLETDASPKSIRWHYETQGYRFLLCMTDALGAWLLHDQQNESPCALEQLIRVRELDELTHLVETERLAGRLRRDDATLIIVSVTHD